MEKQKIGTFEVKELEALNNSIYGNPRFKVVMVDLSSNEEVIATTQTNASIGYNITRGVWLFTYHYTRNKNIIITRGVKK